MQLASGCVLALPKEYAGHLNARMPDAGCVCGGLRWQRYVHATPERVCTSVSPSVVNAFSRRKISAIPNPVFTFLFHLRQQAGHKGLCSTLKLGASFRFAPASALPLLEFHPARKEVGRARALLPQQAADIVPRPPPAQVRQRAFYGGAHRA